MRLLGLALLAACAAPPAPVAPPPSNPVVQVRAHRAVDEGATVAIIKKELNWRWASASFVGMTILAWVGAVLVYQIGTALS